ADFLLVLSAGKGCQILLVILAGIFPAALHELRVPDEHHHVLPILAVRLLLDHDAEEGLRRLRVTVLQRYRPAEIADRAGVGTVGKLLDITFAGLLAEPRLVEVGVRENNTVQRLLGFLRLWIKVNEPIVAN